MLKKPGYKLPKFQPPRLDNIYLRTDVFRQFDKHSHNRVIWISAPAGSGKTIAIASYLREQNRPLLWYQMDEGDEDIASFYYYLGLAGQAAATDKKVKFPLLTPEYSGSLPVFTRNFFRKLFENMENNTVIVLDNFQDVREGCPLIDLLPAALSEIPQGMTIIVVSRYDPPNSFARQRMQSDFSVVNETAFRLKEQECIAIAELRKESILPEEILNHLQSLSQGWMAGFILLLEYASSGHNIDSLSNQQSQAAIFDYFTREVFHGFDKETQDFLLKTSVLPTVKNAIAKQLTGLSSTRHILTTLYKHRFFIVQHDNIKQSFQYHPLFQEFLRHQAELRFSEEEIKSLESKAGQLLLKNGELDAAASLLVQSENWAEFESFTHKHAEHFIIQGRHKTLEHWINKIPDDVLHDNPWLLYWLAYSKQQYDPISARPLLKRAYDLFKSNANADGLYRTWANMVETHVYAWDTFKPLHHWLEEFATIQKTYPRIPGLQLKARVTLAVFSAKAYACPQHADFPAWIKKVQNLYRFVPIEFLKAMIGGQLSVFYGFTGDMSKLNLLVKEMENFSQSEKIPHLARLFSYTIVAAYQILNGNFKQLEAVVNEGEQYADTVGIDLFKCVFPSLSTQHCCVTGNGINAEKHLAQMYSYLDSKRQLDYSYYYYLASRVYFIQGEIDKSFENCKTSYVLCKELGFTFPVKLNELMLAQHLSYKKEYVEALSLTNSVIDFGLQGNFSLIIFMGRYVKGFIYLNKDDIKNAEREIRAALSIGRSQGYYSDMLMTLPIFRAVFVWALARDIETNYVQEVIRRRGFIPSPSERSISNWPWPIKIHTLGRFNILLDEKPVDTSNKSAHKPLALLKVLLAFGGRNVTEEKICDTLWPDADGDKAQQNIKTNLHRLRKLLQHQDAILLNNHQLSLNEALCWIDYWDMNHLLDQTEQDNNKSDKTAQNPQICERLLQGYTGAFLTDDTENWTIDTRERLQARFNRATLQVALQLEDKSEWDTAIRCYERILDNDPLPEECYQGLMRCYYKSGFRADAVNVYQKCKQVYSETFGIGPSRQTESLHNKILSNTL